MTCPASLGGSVKQCSGQNASWNRNVLFFGLPVEVPVISTLGWGWIVPSGSVPKSGPHGLWTLSQHLWGDAGTPLLCSQKPQKVLRAQWLSAPQHLLGNSLHASPAGAATIIYTVSMSPKSKTFYPFQDWRFACRRAPLYSQYYMKNPESWHQCLTNCAPATHLYLTACSASGREDLPPRSSAAGSGTACLT